MCSLHALVAVRRSGILLLLTSVIGTGGFSVTIREQHHVFTGIRPSALPTIASPSRDHLVLFASTEEGVLEEQANATNVASDALLPVVDTAIVLEAQEAFPDAELEFVTLRLEEHRPLGCTVEESMCPADENRVFVSKVVEGGLASKAGMQVGDVIVAVTGMFGGDDIMPVLEVGIEKIKSFISAADENDALVIQMARGTGVMERHESAVVDLCTSPGANEEQVEDCVVDFLAGAYRDDDPTNEEEIPCDSEDDDAECMLDNMMNMWAEELPLPPTTSGISDQPAGDSAKKPKPWSSRSSPSGTYVRDPVTGEMRNIDA